MTATAQKGHNQFGELPVWDLSDLYPGKDSPEFAADLEQAKADAIRFEADYKGKLIELTVSLGCSTLLPAESAESLLRRADSALYVAKREGRNRLAMAG